MPEIWLRYGSTEVVLDIKAENLLDYVTEETEDLTEEQVSMKLEAVVAKETAKIAVLSGSQQVAKLASMLVDSLKKRGTSVALGVAADMLSDYRNAFLDSGVQVNKLPNNLSELSGDTIFLSETSFDPLFGFSGAPTQLLKNIGNDAMLEAYKARHGDMPRPGITNGPLSVAHKFANMYDGTSIEAITGSRGFADVIIDKPAKAHQTAIARLESFAKVEVEKGRASIVSPGNRRSTLSSALNSLWNCIDSVKEGGSMTLLAECREGFGSGALERLVEGKVDMNDAHDPVEYTEGLENVLYLDEVSKKYELILISTLPNYYAKNRLKFKTFPKIRDALHHILNVHGPRQKVLVVSDASRVLLKSK